MGEIDNYSAPDLYRALCGMFICSGEGHCSPKSLLHTLPWDLLSGVVN